VNATRGVGGIPIEALEEMYKGESLNQSMSALIKIFEKAVLHRQVNPTYVAEWRRALLLLRKFIGL
jgi:outer membrane protease